MKGQLSIFIIVGLVLVATVTTLILIVNAAQPQQAQPDVQADNATTSTCLSQVTDAALHALKDDGAITAQENGPLAHAPYYITNQSPNNPLFYLGRSNYTGLCSFNGPNAPTGNMYSCPQSIYSLPGRTSIQEQLTYAITGQMRECTGTSKDAEVIMQRDNLVVRYDGEQHQQRVPLTSTWAAIKHVITEETGNSSYQPPSQVTGCNNCQPISVEQGRSGANTTYTFSRNGANITTIHAQNRPLIIDLGDGPQYTTAVTDYECDIGCKINVYSPDDDYAINGPQGIQGVGDTIEFQCGTYDFSITDGRGSTVEFTNFQAGEDCRT